MTGQTRTLTITTGSRQYTRNQPVILMHWTCCICGQAHQRWQLPGNPPRYCPAPEGMKPSACQREGTRRRVAQHRAALKRDMHNSLQPVTDAPPPADPEPPAGVLGSM